jgi:hypothetical protein
VAVAGGNKIVEGMRAIMDSKSCGNEMCVCEECALVATDWVFAV